MKASVVFNRGETYSVELEPNDRCRRFLQNRSNYSGVSRK